MLTSKKWSCVYLAARLFAISAKSDEWASWNGIIKLFYHLQANWKSSRVCYHCCFSLQRTSKTKKESCITSCKSQFLQTIVPMSHKSHELLFLWASFLTNFNYCKLQFLWTMVVASDDDYETWFLWTTILANCNSCKLWFLWAAILQNCNSVVLDTEN